MNPTFTIVPRGRGDFDGMRSPHGRHMNSPGMNPGDPGWLGNPHKWDGNGGEGSLDSVITAFEKDFLEKIRTDPDFHQAVLNLRSKKIGYYWPDNPNHLEVVQKWLAAQPVHAIGQDEGLKKALVDAVLGVKKIISGGQTGGDHGGLLAGRALGMKTGGTVPLGGRREGKPWTAEGMAEFGLVEHYSTSFVPRTKKNVDDADATIAILWGNSVGTMKTIGYAQTGRWDYPPKKPPQKVYKPVLVVSTRDPKEAIEQVERFLLTHRPKTINIAGHRESSFPGIERFTRDILVSALKPGLASRQEAALLSAPKETQGKPDGNPWVRLTPNQKVLAQALADIPEKDNNIASPYRGRKSNGLQAALTNMTFQKYGIDPERLPDLKNPSGDVLDRHGLSAEGWYQANKQGGREAALKANKAMMQIVIEAKFAQYPELAGAVRLKGGVSWLESQDHRVGVRGSLWEGRGRESQFIDTLIRAYEAFEARMDWTQHPVPKAVSGDQGHSDDLSGQSLLQAQQKLDLKW